MADIAGLLARRTGLEMDPAVRGRLARAVRMEIERSGEQDAAYAERLGRDPAALQDLLNRVTVQETSFFRDPAQFAALAEHVLPPLVDAGLPVQVWSAACANGQEAYSLAMVLAESALRTWHVFATDISTKALARTTAARYEERELSGLSPERRSRHLVPGDRPGSWDIAPALRSRVSVGRHNLAADPPPVAAGRCQVVFCRNVLIYFGRDDVVAFLNRLSAWMPGGGHLFLGYSESLWMVTDRFHLERLGDAFVYRNGPAPVGVTPARATSPAAAPPRRPPTAAPARPVAAPAPPPRVAAPALEAWPAGAGLLAEGEAAMGAGDHAGAVRAFRKAAFVEPDQPLAHLSLGLALEAAGDADAAQRAFVAARAAFGRADRSLLEASLEGYQLEELQRLLDLKAGAP
jgi:chemotaxis methyl-accepting protein methylase